MEKTRCASCVRRLTPLKPCETLTKTQRRTPQGVADFNRNTRPTSVGLGGRLQRNAHPEVPLDDKSTYRLLSAGDTVGVFQLESAGMRELLAQLKPERFEDLIAVCALYRPGPLGSGMVEIS